MTGPLFQQALQDRWDALPPASQRLHSVLTAETFTGTAEVVRGASTVARLTALVFRFPKAGQGVPVTVTKTVHAQGETWVRIFAERRFRSHLSSSDRRYRVRERFGPFTFEMYLPVTDGVMSLPVKRGWFLGIPMPKWTLPTSESREFEKDGQFWFDVGLYAPIGGLIVRYIGWLEPEASK